ncbi:MAG: metal-dependent hydrolase, partial [Zetaproteobacteria bacterium]
MALARALPKHRPPRRHVILLALLAMAPDIDIVLRLHSDLFYLQHHRGITHSLLMLPLWVLLLRALLRRGQCSLPASWIAAALALHILLDLITSFGTMILAPWSDWRATLDLVFIIDPLFTACLLLPLLAAFIVRRHARALAICALLLAAGYLTATAMLHRQALRIARNMQPQASQVYALPLPFSPFRWQLIADFPDHYRRFSLDLLPAFKGSAWLLPASFVHAFKDPDQSTWQRLAKLDAAHPAAKTRSMAFYRWFARFPFVLQHTQTTLELADLRFVSRTGNHPPPFRLRLDVSG